MQYLLLTGAQLLESYTVPEKWCAAIRIMVVDISITQAWSTGLLTSKRPSGAPFNNITRF